MEKTELTTPSKYRIFINRAIVTLKVAVASVLLIYATHPSDAESAMLCVAWLLLFEGMSWAARSPVRRPTSVLDLRWLKSFLLISLGTSILFPFGSLFFRAYASFAYFFGPPSTEELKIGTDMILIGIPFLIYIYYVILAYDDMDTRTLWQRIKPSINYFTEKKIRLLYLLISIPILYQAYFSIHEGNGSPDMRRLTGVDVTGVTSANSVGRKSSIYVDGTFSSGKTYRITSPVFGTKYTSSDPSVVTVSDKGIAIGVAPGRAVIRVENRGHVAEVPVRIYETQEEIVLWTDADEAILPGSEVSLYASIKNNNLEKINMFMRVDGVWGNGEKGRLSDDVFVATLKVPDHVAGEARFHAYARVDDGEEYASYISNTVTLLVKPDLSKLTRLKFNDEERITFVKEMPFPKMVIGVFSDGSEYNLSSPRLGTVVSSSDPSVAELVPTVSHVGNPIYTVKWHKLGETEITATNSGISSTVILEITERARKNNGGTR